MTSLRNYTGNIRAPEFPPDLQWLNTGRPLTLAELRGKLVLLDFWTYGCINCMHVIPDLQRLEREFADALVVIGVHSAKFANEGEAENLRRTVQRYEHRASRGQRPRVRRLAGLCRARLAHHHPHQPRGARHRPPLGRGRLSGAARADRRGDPRPRGQGHCCDRAPLDLVPRGGPRPTALQLSRQGAGRRRQRPPLHRRHRPSPHRGGHAGRARAGRDRRGTARPARRRFCRGRVAPAAGPGAGWRHALHRRHRESRAARGRPARAHGAHRGRRWHAGDIARDRPRRPARGSTRRGTWCASGGCCSSPWRARTSSGR